jgi:hypothetical protein
MGSKKPTEPTTVETDAKILKLQTDLATLRAKYKQALKAKTIEEEILEFSKKTVQALPRVPVPRGTSHNSQKTRESVVLVGSCWHIGENIDATQMGNLNAYNFEIFCKRLQFLVDKTVSFTMDNMSNHAFEELVILLLGDMVSGIIHDLPETNELTIVEQANLGALVTAQAFLELAKVFPRVRVNCVVGNHGRIKQHKYYTNKQPLNWDYIFYQTLALLLKDQPNISFHIPQTFWADVEIQGHKFLIMHGDTMQGSGHPMAKLAKEAAKWSQIKAINNDSFKYLVSSHYHTVSTMQTSTGALLLNGSVKGSCPYSINLGLHSDPVQLLFGVHEQYGKSWGVDLNCKFTDLEVNSRYKYSRSKGLSEQLSLVGHKKK